MRIFIRRWLIRLLVNLLSKTNAAVGSLGQSDEVSKVAIMWPSRSESDVPFAALRVWIEDQHALDVLLSPAQLLILSQSVMQADGALAASYGYPERPDFDMRYIKTVV